jgi:hypothetical protein
VPAATALTTAKPGTKLVEQIHSPLANDLLFRPLDHTKDMPQDGVGSSLLSNQCPNPVVKDQPDEKLTARRSPGFPDPSP